MEKSDGDGNKVEDSLKNVRKYRKKLRQIERLETSERELTNDERLKLHSKGNIRAHLQRLLSSINRREESFNSSSATDLIDESSDDGDSDDDKLNEHLDIATPQEDILKESTTVAKTTEQPPPNKKPFLEEKSEESQHEDISHQPSKPTPSEDEHRPKKDKKPPKPRSQLRKLWKSKVFSVTAFSGHNDLVCAVAANSGWLVSASRDTSAKLWDIASKRELRNLSGHTGSVTSVRLLDVDESDRLRSLVTVESESELMHDLTTKEYPQELLLLTASTDCYIKLWLLPQGCCIKSIYTFSPLTAMCFHGAVVFAGSDSGKLIAYDVVSSQQLCDLRTHKDTVTSLECRPPSLVSTSTDGDLRIWNIQNKQGQPASLDMPETSIDLKDEFSLRESEHYIVGRQVLCSCLHENSLFYGDDGVNLKVLDIEKGSVAKYPNHKSHGFADACCVKQGFLFTSSYDLDTGAGSINVRSIRDEQPLGYVSTLCHAEVPRLMSVAVDRTYAGTCFFTGGPQLLMWKEVDHHKFDESSSLEKDGVVFFKGRAITEMGKNFAPSDVESDTSDGETDSGRWWWSKPVETSSKRPTTDKDSDTDSDASGASVAKEESAEGGWMRWCTVI